jgi:hypothetical protein
VENPVDQAPGRAFIFRRRREEEKAVKKIRLLTDINIQQNESVPLPIGQAEQ